jgi:hypothetical protein
MAPMMIRLSWPIVRALLVASSYVLGLGVAYALLPLDRSLRGDGFGWLTAALVLIAACTAIQIRAILRSTSPGVRGVQALLTLVTLLLVSFASIYVSLSHNTPSSFSQPLNHVAGMYFSVTVFATVGFGDITPISDAARVIVTTQMLLDLAMVGLGVKVILGAVKLRREERQSG